MSATAKTSVRSPSVAKSSRCASVASAWRAPAPPARRGHSTESAPLQYTLMAPAEQRRVSAGQEGAGAAGGLPSGVRTTTDMRLRADVKSTTCSTWYSRSAPPRTRTRTAAGVRVTNT